MDKWILFFCINQSFLFGTELSVQIEIKMCHKSQNKEKKHSFSNWEFEKWKPCTCECVWVCVRVCSTLVRILCHSSKRFVRHTTASMTKIQPIQIFAFAPKNTKNHIWVRGLKVSSVFSFENSSTAKHFCNLYYHN